MEETETLNQPEDFPEGKFSARSLARTVAFQIAYQDDLNPGSKDRFAESFIEQELPDHEAVRRFTRNLIAGIAEKHEEIDDTLTEIARHWSLSRMTTTDRSILRLATYEIMFMDTPKPVVIDEAVELAKRFGTADSAAFVNGILDKIRKKRPETSGE